MAIILPSFCYISLVIASVMHFAMGNPQLQLSCLHNILHLMKNGFGVSLVFFDLRKAFDIVPHLPLLQKLGLNQHIL